LNWPASDGYAQHETPNQFRVALERLERETLGGLDLVAGQLARALESINQQNAELAHVVLADDAQIDQRYVQVHHGVLVLLARQPPIAGDLRILAALLQIIRCVERMGDQCVNMAKLVPLSSYDAPKDVDLLDAIQRMGQLALSRVAQAREALGSRSVPLARDIIGDGKLVGRLNREIFGHAVQIGDDVAAREWAMFMVLVARCLERIADNAVVIAQHTVFIVTGSFREPVGARLP
jgi:phosphate transport system protein